MDMHEASGWTNITATSICIMREVVCDMIHICVINRMVSSAHRLKVVVRIIKAMANQCNDRFASVTESQCQLVTNTVGNDDSDGDCTFAPVGIAEQGTIQGGYLKHPVVL